MKIFALLDGNNICQCIASLECNLHQDKIDAGMRPIAIDFQPLEIGDEVTFSGREVIITPHPENYIGQSEDEIREEKITAEVRRIAEQSLIDRGEIQ